MTAPPENPRNCDRLDDCRITSGGAVSTLLHWEPVYDGHGKQTNQNPNTTSWNEHCSTCNRMWSMNRCAGVTTRKELK